MPSVTSTMHSLHLPFLWHEVGTCTPICSAYSKSERPVSACVVCPLMMRVTAMVSFYQLASLPIGFGLELRLEGVGHFLGCAGAVFFVAPIPLGQVVVGGA